MREWSPETKTKPELQNTLQWLTDIVKVKLLPKCNLGFFMNAYESNLCVEA